MSDPAVKAGLSLLVVIILAAVAFFLVARLRDYTNRDWESTSESLSKLKEMRLKGDISEEEFRTIQAAARVSTKAEPHQTQSDPNRDQQANE